MYDIDAARKELLSHGVEVSEVFHDAGSVLGAGFRDGTEARAPGPDPQGRSYGSYASFSDPDGNGWLLQEIKVRLPGMTRHKLNGEMTHTLLETLKSAAAAHGVHEKELGKPDPDWPHWYAEHMARTLAGAGYHLTGPRVFLPGKTGKAARLKNMAGRRIKCRYLKAQLTQEEKRSRRR